MEQALFYLWFVLAPKYSTAKTSLYFEANYVGEVHNEWTNCLRVYRHLLTNSLHGKAAELCLANS